MQKLQTFLSKLIPFILLGIAIFAFALGIILLAYVLLFGALIGFILFMISWIKNKFFTHKQPPAKVKTKSGRIIDSDDWRKL